MSKPPESLPPKPRPARGPDSVPPPRAAKQALRQRPEPPKADGAGKQGGSGKRGRAAKPTPARPEGRSATGASEPPADVRELTFALEGADWCVHVLGRSGGTSKIASTPLLLLGFRSESQTAHDREAWIVGRALSDLTPEQLEIAFKRSVPPADPNRPRAFFGEASGRRRR